MAAETLLWEDPVEIASGGSPAGVVHYFTEQAQALYLSGSDLDAALVDAKGGAWDSPGEGYTVDDTRTYAQLRLDHPAFGILYGAVSGGSLHLLTCLYAADISDWASKTDMTIQADKPIHSMAMQILDTDKEYFEGDDSLFSPGNVITLDVTWGTGAPWLPMYIWYSDGLPYDELADRHTLQARTALGMWLKDVSFDEDNTYSGQRDAVVRAIIEDGATVLDPADIIVQTDITAVEVAFKPSDKRLDSLLKWLEPEGWKIAQLPDGRVVVGNNAFIRTYQANTRYSFQRDRDVFTRKIIRNADPAYSRVCAYAADYVRMQYADIATFPGWAISRKTWYEEAPAGSHADGGMTDAELLALAQTVAVKMQYAGVTESLYGPMRPELLPGDVAQLYNEATDNYTTTGIVTEVKHQFGEKGYQTFFATDSGGDFTDVGDDVESSSRIIDGANRQRRITDFIRKDTNRAIIVASASSAAGLSKKADKVCSPTAGHLAGLDAAGNLTDSGKAPGDFAGAARAACRAYRDTAQSIPNDTETAVTLPSEDYDANDMHDPTTNPSRITIQSDGIYVVMAAIEFAADSAGTRIVSIKKNGTAVLAKTEAAPLSAGNTILQVAAMAALEDDDYIEIYVTQDSGDALDVVAAWLVAVHITN